MCLLYTSKRLFRLFLALLLPFLAACSDQRATFEIQGNTHALSLIRTTSAPWDKSASYSIVAARMPDCMRRHALPKASLNARWEIFSPGNEAWIIRQGQRVYVTETRTCEGFSVLDQVPPDGYGPLMGMFEMKNDTLVFSAAPPPPPEPRVPIPTVILAPNPQ